MSRRWVLSSLVAVGAITVLAGATVASAHARGGGPGGEVMDRVASILGIERSALDDAFDQARSEIADEQRADALASLVENGTLTSEEADAIADWLDARPAVVEGLKPASAGVFRFHAAKPELHSLPGTLHIPSFTPELLARLVDSGKLSQDDADAIQAWLDARPAAVDKLVPDPVKKFEGITPFGGGFFRFDGESEPFDLDDLKERLEEFKESIPEFDGERPTFPEFRFPDGGFFEFEGDGFKFEFKGDGPGFFFRGGEGERGHGFGGFNRFHRFQPDALEAPQTPGEPDPVNL